MKQQPTPLPRYPLGHQDPSDNAEILLLAKLDQGSDKVQPEAVGIEQARAAVGAGSQKVKMIEAIVMLLARHDAILQLRIAHIANSAMYAPPATGPRTTPDPLAGDIMNPQSLNRYPSLLECAIAANLGYTRFLLNGSGSN